MIFSREGAKARRKRLSTQTCTIFTERHCEERDRKRDSRRGAEARREGQEKRLARRLGAAWAATKLGSHAKPRRREGKSYPRKLVRSLQNGTAEAQRGQEEGLARRRGGAEVKRRWWFLENRAGLSDNERCRDAGEGLRHGGASRNRSLSSRWLICASYPGRWAGLWDFAALALKGRSQDCFLRVRRLNAG